MIYPSDFSHFLHPDKGKVLDDLVLDKILKFESESVQNVVRKNNISVCGYGPIMALMEYSKLVNTNPQNIIISRGHSGEVIPSNEVVDYVSILFYK